MWSAEQEEGGDSGNGGGGLSFFPAPGSMGVAILGCDFHRQTSSVSSARCECVRDDESTIFPSFCIRCCFGNDWYRLNTLDIKSFCALGIALQIEANWKLAMILLMSTCIW